MHKASASEYSNPGSGRLRWALPETITASYPVAVATIRLALRTPPPSSMKSAQRSR